MYISLSNFEMTKQSRHHSSTHLTREGHFSEKIELFQSGGVRAHNTLFCSSTQLQSVQLSGNLTNTHLQHTCKTCHCLVATELQCTCTCIHACTKLCGTNLTESCTSRQLGKAPQPDQYVNSNYIVVIYKYAYDKGGNTGSYIN